MDVEPVGTEENASEPVILAVVESVDAPAPDMQSEIVDESAAPTEVPGDHSLEVQPAGSSAPQAVSLAPVVESAPTMSDPKIEEAKKYLEEVRVSIVTDFLSVLGPRDDRPPPSNAPIHTHTTLQHSLYHIDVFISLPSGSETVRAAAPHLQ